VEQVPALRSRALGFTQELFVNGNDEVPPEMTALMLQQMAMQFPNLGRLVRAVFHDTGSTLGRGCDDQFEFESRSTSCSTGATGCARRTGRCRTAADDRAAPVRSGTSPERHPPRTP
jgi:hypothetical protein